MKKHKKPAGLYGYINFSKEGKVKKVISKLPDEKNAQEMHISESFVELIKNRSRNLSQPQTLDEGNHDFLTKEKDYRIEVQVVELPIHLVAESIYSRDKEKWIHATNNKEFYKLVRNGALMLLHEKQVYDQLLLSIIKGKIGKHYSKPSKRKLWLLVWSIYPYETEYYTNGVLTISDALKLARNYLNTNKSIFGEIWFFNMTTNPVCIYSENNSRS